MKGLLRYNYPQRVFGRRIMGHLKDIPVSKRNIIDCPCGNGETSSFLADLNNAKITAADISEEAIKNAKKNFAHANIKFEVNTIEAVLSSNKQFDVFCIVNSLFLLENYDTILRDLSRSASDNNAMVFVIIPNTEGKNFKWFQSQNTGENKLIISKNEINAFFEKYGFRTKLVEPVCYTHHFGRKDIKLFSVFWGLYLNFINVFQTLFRIGKPNYFLIALSAQ